MPVSPRALLARINRKLVHDGECMKTCRSDSRWWHDLGDYYVVDLSRNFLTHKHYDLEEWGRDLGMPQALRGARPVMELAGAAGGNDRGPVWE